MSILAPNADHQIGLTNGINLDWRWLTTVPVLVWLLSDAIAKKRRKVGRTE